MDNSNNKSREQLERELAQARAALSQSDDQFRSILDASPVPFALNDEQQNITYLNPAFIRTFGYDLNDIPTLDHWWPKAYPDEQYRQWVADTWQVHLNEAITTGQPFKALELIIHCKDESTRNVLVYAASLKERYEGIHLVILQDITEQKQTQTELETTLNLLDNVINSTPDLIFVKNKQLQTILCNQAFASLLGKNREDLYGHTDIENGLDPELVHGNPDKGIRGYMDSDKDALAGKNIHNPHDLGNINGELRIFETHKLPLRNTNNDIFGVLGIARDITQRKQVEDELRQQQKLLREIAANYPNSYISIIEKDYTIGFTSGQAFKKQGLDPVQFTGLKVETIFGNQAEFVLQHYQRAFTGEEVEFELYIEKQFQLYHCIPLFEEDKSVKRILVVVEDITERKITEEQLRHSQKMDALGKLTGGIAHDFNNMLGVIMGYTELLQHQLPDNETLKRYADAIQSAGNRAQVLTSKLLAFSRKQPSDAKCCNVNEILLGDQHMLEKTLTAKINLVFDLQQDPWPVFIDSEMLADAILNICINAMHAMPKGGTLRISTCNIVLDDQDTKQLSIKPGEYFKLSLSDTGHGMDATTKEQIFEPFFTTKGNQGTGLGMSQVYGMVKQSRGDIRVLSEPNQGTEVIIYLPRHLDLETANQKTSTTSLAKHSASDKNILIVDDEFALRELAYDILKPDGYNVFCADSAQQALDILSENKIDLMLSDVIMPEIDGYQLAAEVRQNYPQIKIQMVSGYDDAHFTQNVNKELQDNQLYKPYRSVALLNRIRELLDS